MSPDERKNINAELRSKIKEQEKIVKNLDEVGLEVVGSGENIDIAIKKDEAPISDSLSKIIDLEQEIVYIAHFMAIEVNTIEGDQTKELTKIPLNITPLDKDNLEKGFAYYAFIQDPNQFNTELLGKPCFLTARFTCSKSETIIAIPATLVLSRIVPNELEMDTIMLEFRSDHDMEFYEELQHIEPSNEEISESQLIDDHINRGG